MREKYIFGRTETRSVKKTKHASSEIYQHIGAGKLHGIGAHCTENCTDKDMFLRFIKDAQIQRMHTLKFLNRVRFERKCAR
jgi:hypothetical protein